SRADLERAPTRLRLVADRRALDVQPLCDEAGEIGKRTAELTLESLPDLLELLVVGSVVDEEHRPPACRGEDIARDQVDGRGVEAAHVNTGDRPALEVIRV